MRSLRDYALPLAGAIGAAAIACGFWWIWPPLGLIAGGVLVLADVLCTLKSRHRPDDS